MSKETKATTSTATTAASNPQEQTQAQSQETGKESAEMNISEIIDDYISELDKEHEEFNSEISKMTDAEFGEMIKKMTENKSSLSGLLSRARELGVNIEILIKTAIDDKNRRDALLKAINITETENNNEEEITMSIYKTENKNSKRKEAFRKNIIENIDFDAVSKAPVEVLANEYTKWISDFGYDVVHKCVAELNNQFINKAEAKVISMVMSGGDVVESVPEIKKKEKPLSKVIYELFDKIYKDLKGSEEDLEDDIDEVIETLKVLNKKFGPETIRNIWREEVQDYNPNTNTATKIRGETAKGIFIDCLLRAGCISEKESAMASACCSAAISAAKLRILAFGDHDKPRSNFFVTSEGGIGYKK